MIVTRWVVVVVMSKTSLVINVNRRDIMQIDVRTRLLPPLLLSLLLSGLVLLLLVRPKRLLLLLPLVVYALTAGKVMTVQTVGSNSRRSVLLRTKLLLCRISAWSLT